MATVYNAKELTAEQIFGKLYNWYAVNDPRGLAPAGWHIPTNTEWTTLVEFLGGIFIAGGKMKETGTAHWLSPNDGASNSTKFTALPGGFYESGKFDFIGGIGRWWTSTEFTDGVTGPPIAAMIRYTDFISPSSEGETAINIPVIPSVVLRIDKILV